MFFYKFLIVSIFILSNILIESTSILGTEISTSSTVPAVIQAKSANQISHGSQDAYLTTLPPDFMPFEEFEKEFALGNTSTEQQHPITKHLSQVMHKSIPDGMKLLLQVDEDVVSGFRSFIPSIAEKAQLIANKIIQGGRVFLIGSGSSGRIAIDIAAKCGMKFPRAKKQVQGIIAGGDSALIRAKEGFEDSESDGEQALKDFNLTSKDTVILISASGSAFFNVGCGHFYANKGAHVLYFYNSQSIPLRTKALFERSVNPVTPLCLDIGPQAIGGSTRLQGATLAESCLGALLVSTLYLAQGDDLLAEEYPVELALKMQAGIEIIKDNLNDIQKFPEIECAVFANPNSNFKRLKDISNQGYVTFVALEDSMREILIDTTETSPTFSTNPMRRENEAHRKRAEFRAYLIGQDTNSKAWAALLGREVYPSDTEDAQSFLLAYEENGVNSFSKRPLIAGNFLIGVAKVNASGVVPHQLLEVLKAAKNQGASTGLLIICTSELSKNQLDKLESNHECSLILQNIPSDAVSLTETIILKQILNLISNSSMALMNKIHGNQMIDVRASNKKLIDRCIRLVKSVWTECQSKQLPDDKLLYHYIVHTSAIKKSYEEEGTYTPSLVKIMMTMLALKKTPSNFQEVIDYLAEKQESIDWIRE